MQELYINGPILWGDLSAFADCPKLHLLHSSFPLTTANTRAQGLRLPPTLEEISGINLSDAAIEELVALPNLKVVYAPRSTSDPVQMAAVQKLRDRLAEARPTVQIR